VVEDNPIYYSRYLPLLYDVVMEQTRFLIDDVSTDELYKVLRLRARPKILLATNYEEAKSIINSYKDYLLCLITDVEFDRKGVCDEHAGFRLADYAKRIKNDLPTVIQSSEEKNAEVAYALQATYIDKNSDTLKQDFKSFITHYLGFGNFVYRDKTGRQIGIARTLREFELQLKRIPEESLMYHARKDHFSMWLMARGEIQAAKILNPQKVSDFESPTKIRNYLIEVIHTFRNEQNKGKVIPFTEDGIIDETNIISLAEGSLGGKGRGLAFVNTLIHNLDFSQYIPDINIRTPKTAIIGIEEFEIFLNRNEVIESVLHEKDYNKVKQIFLDGNLSKNLIKKLKVIIKKINKPLAVRSSGLFEDSMMQPFAGIFETYYIPNNHPDQNVRLQQLMDAVKLVYASVFSDVARQYVEAVNYKIEQERMAVVIQELVGNRFGNVFYPHISGVAQSYNYYPVAHMKPEEGFGIIALGLGKYVVEGEKCYRFSPRYPDSEISSQKDQFKNSQTEFFALDLKNPDIHLLDGDTAGLVRLGIDEAERHGSLKHLASVYDTISNRIIPGLRHPGARVVNFANILKYNYIPLAKTIEVVLDVVEEALGTPVEIEFAVDLNKDSDYKSSFYLLQIKPLIGSNTDYEFNPDEIDKEKTLLFAEKAMGNGVIENITDVIYVALDRFDKSATPEMAEEMNKLNEQMIAAGRQYLLIGPGRWGTRDRYIGIPVKWPNISNAKVIVETSLEGYPLDASSGSHFFHNVTSMQVGYFSIQQEVGGNYIKWDVLNNQKPITKTKYFNHIQFKNPLKIKMDGKRRVAVIEI
ncbi:MAG: PEP/pyruvate-binding domain-containing protein, partial [Bacteroidales bacterium]|nr:PEP/pyruvate-binding domain-containing protein [Bacteroidales bacterium]